jgi:hypothetical protein
MRVSRCNRKDRKKGIIQEWERRRRQIVLVARVYNKTTSGIVIYGPLRLSAGEGARGGGKKLSRAEPQTIRGTAK